MRRLASIGFLLLTIFQIAGFFIVFRIAQVSHRYGMYEQLERSWEEKILVELIIPANRDQASQLGYRFEGRREIIFNGIYYDIVRSEPAGSSVKFTCYADHKESEMAQRWSDNHEETDPQSRVLLLNLMRLMTTPFAPLVPGFPQLSAHEATPSITQYLPSFSNFILPTKGPPPKMIG